jgi:membrane fusion protein
MLSSSVAMWLLTVFLIIICAGAMIFATTASYARAELVPGMVAPAAPLAKIVAPRPGLVTDLLVEEGQTVRAGQVLARVRLEQPSLAGSGTASASLQSLEQQRQLAGEQMRLERQRVAAVRQGLQTQLASATAQIAELDRQIVLQREVIASTRVAVDQAEALIGKGFMTRSDLEQRRQFWLAALQAGRQMAQSRGALQGQAASARAELARLPVESAATLVQLRTNIAQLEMASAQQAGEKGYQVTAPINGRVTAVQTAIGRYADGRVPLLTIVPHGVTMRAELFAPSRAMGFVRSGQEVRVLYDAFPYQRFGSFPGRVEQVSRTVIAPGEGEAPVALTEPVYRIRVSLPQQGVPAYGSTAPLQPGMTLKANIILERRSFLAWLLDPVMAVKNRT